VFPVTIFCSCYNIIYKSEINVGWALNSEKLLRLETGLGSEKKLHKVLNICNITTSRSYPSFLLVEFAIFQSECL
jgi:hypothetical protein